jgi:hypothetical protein
MYDSYCKTKAYYSFALMAAMALLVCSQAQASLNFADFSDTTGLQLNGDAAQVGSSLRIVPALTSKSGSVFAPSPQDIGIFSTAFKFKISETGGISDGIEAGADGITFTIQNTGSTVTGGLGGGIGYSGIPQSVAVEFDTYNNGWDPVSNSNHAGINIGGSVTSEVTVPVTRRFNDGDEWYVWIDYDGSILEVRMGDTDDRPDDADLSMAIDIVSLVGASTAYVGFTGGTGGAYGNHDLLCWSFNRSPDCSEAQPSVAALWPPNHKFVPIKIIGVTDPDGDPITITIDSIRQDEPVKVKGSGNTTPDGRGVGTDTAEVRAERTGTKKVPGNGRVYHIGFTADDGYGGICSGTVLVCVPHDRSDGACVDDGPLYDSTLP